MERLEHIIKVYDTSGARLMLLSDITEEKAVCVKMAEQSADLGSLPGH